MSTVCDVASESFTLGDRIATATRSKAAETFALHAGMRARVAQHVVESFELGDGAHPNHLRAVVRETFRLHANATAHTRNPRNGAREAFVLGANLRAVVRDVAAESFDLHSAASSPIPRGIARESFRLHSNVVSRQLGFRNAARETFRLHARVRAGTSGKASETFALHAHATNLQRLRNRAAESFTLGDAAGRGWRPGNAAREVFRLHAAARHAVEAMNVARETFYLGDAIHAAGGPGGAAWAAPTDTFAMSRYEHAAMRTVGVVGDTIIASGEGGFYALVPEVDDEGAVKIAAEIRSGLIDIGVPTTRDQGAKETGDPRQKRGAPIYIAYRGGRLKFGIGITSSGTEERYWYDFPDRTADDFTSNRATMGRGARSRFWRFLLANVEGAPFIVKEQRVVLFSTSRRI